MSRTIPSRVIAAACFLAVAIAALLAVLAYGSRGPEVTLDAPATARADEALNVAVHGDLHGDGAVSVTLGEPGRPCTAPDASVVVPALPAPGTFRATGAAPLGPAGRYELCAWARVHDGKPRVLARRAVAVRPPAATVAVVAPPIADDYDTFRMTLRGTTEVPQPLVLLALRDPRACDARAPRYVEQDVIDRTAVEGRFETAFEDWLTEQGRWTLCAVLGDPEHPVAVARRPILVADL